MPTGIRPSTGFAAVVAFRQFWLGYVLPTPGDSVFAPVVIIVFLGLVALGIGWRVRSGDRHRNLRRRFGVVAFVCTLAASVWSVEFAMPLARLGPDSSHGGVRAPGGGPVVTTTRRTSR